MPGPEPGQRWGILGGVFDPVHRGHLILAEEVLSLGQLDGVLFLPADKTPHRQLKPGASFKHRRQMLQQALADYPVFHLDPIENEQALTGYTLHALQALKKRYSGVEFQFIIGADNLSSFKTWHRWEEVLREVRLLVGCRPDSEPVDLRDFPEDRVVLFDTSSVGLSSTVVRKTIKAGVTPEKLKEMVPDKVAEYILREGLYK